MGSNQVVFDISSDEEPSSFNDSRHGGDNGSDDDHHWLTELLETVDRETSDSSDEVVIVGEFTPSKSKSSNPVKDVDDDDDDCVVLDCDPEKTVDVVDDRVDNDGDDVLVVGEKGQIACRDYPHPRHLCAKHPFTSTPHERHCKLCHCYVCDVLAPCTHWGTGVSNVDHCNATDKLDVWKCQRQASKLRKSTPLPHPEIPHANVPVPVCQVSQVAALENIQFAPHLAAHNKVSRPIAVHACSSARSSVPNIISQTRNRQPGYAQGRNGLLPRAISHQAIGVGVRNNRVPRLDKGEQFLSNIRFKRPGVVGGDRMPVKRCMYGSSNNLTCAPASQYPRNADQRTMDNAKCTRGWQSVLPSKLISDPYSRRDPSQPNMANVSVAAAAPLSESYCQPAPQSNDGGVFYQPGNQTQNVAGSGFPGFDLDWLNNLSPSDGQSPSENIQCSSTWPNNEPSAVKQPSWQSTGSTERMYKDDEYESWFLRPSGSVASEDCMPADFVFSPECSTFDAGMLCFDFETSWNGLTQV